MEIKLQRLCIENFKGCKSQRIDFANTTNVYGANAAGKTTLMDAFMWLLFNKDSSGATNFNIRPVDSDGKQIDNVEISVEATLLVDESELVLHKTQKQNWVKKRGTDTAVLQGNVNMYEINSFPAQEKEFKEKINEIISEDLFKLLTDPRTFAALPWKKQREIVMKFVSETTDDDVLNTDPEKYAFIAGELQQAPIEKCIEKAKKAMGKLKDRQKELPARIDEASKALVDIPDLAEMELQRNALKEQLEDVQQQKEDLSQAYKSVEDIRGEIMQTKFDLNGIAQSADEIVKKTLRDARRNYDEANDEANYLYDQSRKKDVEIENLKRDLRYKKQDIAAKQDEYRKKYAEDLAEGSMICPTCGQELPDARRSEITAEFKINKKKALDVIVAAGNMLKTEIESLQKKITENEAEFEKLKDAWTRKASESGKAYEYMNSLPNTADLSVNQEYQTLQDKLSNLETQLGNMDTGEGIKHQLSIKEKEIREELDALNRKFAAVDANERARDRIADLQDEQKEVGQQVADQERKLYLLEEFSRAKIELLSSAINNRFDMVNFKMFDTQINGGLKETCEMTVNGVPYSSLNSAAKLQAGLDVINSLSGLYGVSAPIWIDNRESVSVIPKVDAQVINLYVSPTDKILRIEEG